MGAYMKRVASLAIVIIMLFVGYKINSRMEISPFKEQVSNFVSLLKQDKPFEAQELLYENLQYHVSIENLSNFAVESNIKKAKEISWDTWSSNDGNYTIEGSLLFEDDTSQAIKSLLTYNKEEIEIIEISLGDREIKSVENNSTGFLR